MTAMLRHLPLLLLLAPVAFAVRMLTVWSRLPDAMATHFGVSGEPDSYLPPIAFLVIGVGALTLTSVLAIRRSDDFARQAISAGVTVLIAVAFWQVVSFNLGEGDVSIVQAAVAALVAALVVGAAGWWASQLVEQAEPKRD